MITSELTFIRILAMTAVAVAALWLAGTARGAWTDCTRSGVTVTMTTDGTSEDTLSVGGDGAILANGTQCADATTANTDSIRLLDSAPPTGNVAPHLTIDLSGGPFAPGATDEPGSTSDEIEIHLELSAVALPVLTVVGGPGDDHIVAGALGLNLNADEPDDDVDVTYDVTDSDLGNAVLDRLVGADGNDQLSNAGGEGTGGAWPFSTPLLDGGPGNDTLSAGAEDARLVGASGDDLLRGGPDDDDELEGGPGFDRLDGGYGSDRLDGGPGDDWALYGTAPGPVSVTLPGGTASGGDGYGATDTFTSIEQLEGSAFDDRLVGDSGDNRIFAGGGNDTVLGRGGADSIRGFDGDDTVDGGPGDDPELAGDAGNDTVRGGGGNDQLSDGPGDDKVLGEGGDDVIEASEWDPDLGLGSIGADLLSGGPGRDTVRYWYRDSGVTVTLDGVRNDGPTGLDNVGGPADDVENLEGSLHGNDSLTGNDRANKIDGHGGDDTVAGAGGRDRIDGGAGKDTLSGGRGRDEIIADDGEADTVDGGPGRDSADVDAFDSVTAVERRL